MKGYFAPASAVKGRVHRACSPIFWATAIHAAEAKQGRVFPLLPRKYTGEKERGCTLSVTTSRCWNHLPIKLRSSQSVNMFNNDALYNHFKLSQLRDKSYTPFLDNLFLDHMI